MGEVVPIYRDGAHDERAETIRFVCWLIHRPDLAENLVRRCLPLSAAFDEICTATKRMDWSDRRMRRLIGPAGSRRRTLPKFFNTYKGT